MCLQLSFVLSQGQSTSSSHNQDWRELRDHIAISRTHLLGRNHTYFSWASMELCLLAHWGLYYARRHFPQIVLCLSVPATNGLASDSWSGPVRWTKSGLTELSSCLFVDDFAAASNDSRDPHTSEAVCRHRYTISRRDAFIYACCPVEPSKTLFFLGTERNWEHVLHLWCLCSSFVAL